MPLCRRLIDEPFCRFQCQFRRHVSLMIAVLTRRKSKPPAAGFPKLYLNTSIDFDSHHRCLCAGHLRISAGQKLIEAQIIHSSCVLRDCSAVLFADGTTAL